VHCGVFSQLACQAGWGYPPDYDIVTKAQTGGNTTGFDLCKVLQFAGYAVIRVEWQKDRIDETRQLFFTHATLRQNSIFSLGLSGYRLHRVLRRFGAD
jgi:hypothetical protein